MIAGSAARGCQPAAGGNPAQLRPGPPWRRLASLGGVTVLLAWPLPAAAQKAVFVDGLGELTEAAAGTFGDEGPRLEAALDKMAAGLDRWDRSIRAFEARVPSQGGAADSTAATAAARLTLGRMHLERGRLTDALGEIDEAVRLEPHRADLHLLDGVALQASGRTADAVRAFRAAWGLAPDDPVYAYHLLTAAPAPGDAGDAQPALDSLSSAYRRLIARDPRSHTASFLQIPALDPGGATPIVPYASYARAYALLATGDYSGGLADLRRTVGADPLVTDPAGRLTSMKLGTAALRGGRLEEARRHLGTALTRTPGSAEIHRVLGLVYLAAGRYDESLAHLESAVRANPLDERARLTQARVLADAGRTREAERALRTTLDRSPDSPLAHWWLAWIQERLNETSAARRHLELAAPKVLAGRDRLWDSIGRLARIEGDFGGAVTAFARAVGHNLNSAEAHKNLGLAYLDEHRIHEAFRELVAACLIDPGVVEAHAAIGRIYLDQGRYADAVAALRRAVELWPGYYAAHYALAAALTRLGDADGAAREFDAFERASREALASRRRNMALDVLVEEATFRAAEGRLDRAIALWQQVVAREPRNPAHRLNLGAVLTDTGRIHEAIGHYETAAALEGGAEIHHRLAELYARTGRTADSERARKTYDRLRQPAPSGGRDGSR